MAHLDCIRACSADAAGIDSACASACPGGSTSAAQQAAAALDACANAAASSCAECAESDAGSDAPTPTNPVLTQQCTPITDENACNECLWNHCCDSMDAMFQPGPTADLADCWQNCTTVDCEKECYANYPDGIVGFGGWSGCLSHHCVKSGACPSGTDCSQCVADYCSVELTDCQTNVDCHLITQCVAWCDTAACSFDCPSQWPGASTVWEAYLGCVTQRCSTVCN